MAISMSVFGRLWQILPRPPEISGAGVYPEGSDAPGRLPVYRWRAIGPVIIRRFCTTSEVREAFRRRDVQREAE